MIIDYHPNIKTLSLCKYFLKIELSNISDKIIKHISKLSKLEYLNLSKLILK
jgi:hypothetical protein